MHTVVLIQRHRNGMLVYAEAVPFVTQRYCILLRNNVRCCGCTNLYLRTLEINHSWTTGPVFLQIPRPPLPQYSKSARFIYHTWFTQLVGFLHDSTWVKTRASSQSEHVDRCNTDGARRIRDRLRRLRD